MKWRKSPPELIARFTESLPGNPKVEPRKMFGYPCAFVNGNMFTGLHQESMILRLSEERRAAFLKLKGARQFEPMPGRAMKEYVAVPKDMFEKIDVLRSWVGEAFEYASSLKAKTKKAAGDKSKKCKKC